jgi:hypothetical protein
MKSLVGCLFLAVMMIVVASPAYSAPQAKAAPQAKSAASAESADADSSYGGMQILHVFQCEMTPGVTEAQVDAIAQQKLKLLREMPGAEKAQVHVLWPAAVNNMGTTDFQIVWILPSFSDWGKLWDAYNDASPLARGDDATEGKVECPNSALWEAHEIVMPK